MLIFSTDKPRLSHHFAKDKVLFAYHLGDLDDFYFPQCQFACKYRPTRAIIEEVVLIYTGGKVPSVLMFGTTDLFTDLMQSLVDLLPAKFHGHYQGTTAEFLSERYKIIGEDNFIKMHLTELPEGIRSYYSEQEVVMLTERHLKALENLYAAAYPGNYFVPRMLATGRYLGIIQNDNIIAAAGVHVHSDEYEIAVLGNIAVHPDHRSSGLGTAVTAFLSKKLFSEGKLVCLNVNASNRAAIAIYEKLGFTKTHDYKEALFELK